MSFSAVARACAVWFPEPLAPWACPGLEHTALLEIPMRVISSRRLRWAISLWHGTRASSERIDERAERIEERTERIEGRAERIEGRKDIHTWTKRLR